MSLEPTYALKHLRGGGKEEGLLTPTYPPLTQPKLPDSTHIH